MNAFELGKVVVTHGVGELIKSDLWFAEHVCRSLIKYAKCDWGSTCIEDAEQNDVAVKNGDERISAVYTDSENRTIWIITEWDRSVTTILFPEEY